MTPKSSNALAARGIDIHYRGRAVLYWNTGQGRFQDISEEAGPAIVSRHSARGLAVGDIDNDGTLEAVTNNQNEPPSLWKQSRSAAEHWLLLQLVGSRSNRSAIGARVVVSAGGRTQVDEVRSGGSYLSQNDLRPHFGLGSATRADSSISKRQIPLNERIRRVKCHQPCYNPCTRCCSRPCGTGGDMLRKSSRLGRLRNNDCIAVVGGGPAGSFFAIHLLREARQLNLHLDVVIVEKRGPIDLDAACFQCRGCSFCAGGISPRLHEVLEEERLLVPDQIVQARFDYVWIQGQWKNFRLRVPKDMRMYSVFRGSLPGRRSGTPAGFDGFLLGEAVKEGARLLYGEIEVIAYGPLGLPRLTVKTGSGESVPLNASFVTIATGINARCGLDYRDDTLIACLRRLNPAFAPARSRKAFIFELDVGQDYLKRHLDRELYFVEYGSRNLGLEHTALVPKGRFLTVAMLGRCIDRAVLPQDSRQIVHEFLTLPQIERILPGIESAPLACVCAPRMTVSTAKSPYGDRFAIIGDAVGSRLNKDGLFSAHVTASRLAQTVLHEGIDKRALSQGYGKAIQWLAADNRFGKIVFAVSRIAFTRPVIGRITYQAFATEYKLRDEGSRPLGSVLWKIASGTADYRQVLREMCSYGVLRSVLVGAAVTVRNVAFEMFFGLKWGECGRYPTVVLKEKRGALKERLSLSLGRGLGESPGFERMYVIKIRGSGQEIMNELAKFGDSHARFLQLRFVEVRRTAGEPNQTGSVIRYGVPIAGFYAELRLTWAGPESLLYQFDERLADHGVLIFHVAPTVDGNSRLSVYAAFDYKKGHGFAGRIFWRTARLLFPGFVHDVVWNHALCVMKEEVERLQLYARASGVDAAREEC